MERRKFTREFEQEAVRLIKERGVSYSQASRDLAVHQSQLRSWVKMLAEDPQHAFPGQGQMKPEQLEITRLRREVNSATHVMDVNITFGIQRSDQLIHLREGRSDEGGFVLPYVSAVRNAYIEPESSQAVLRQRLIRNKPV